MPAPQLETFREILRLLCIEVENLSIENSVCFDAILETGKINLPTLEQRVAEAQLDPAKRQEARQAFSGMWKAIEDSGTVAVFEDLLNNLPPTDKPN
jgi:hypothetical protein